MFGFEIPIDLYIPLYYWIVFAFCCMLFLMNYGNDSCEGLLTKKTQIPAFLLVIVLFIFIGGRPMSGRLFGDTGNYALSYNRMKSFSNVSVNFDTEWFWTVIMNVCKSMKMDVKAWFTVIACGYFGFIFVALKKMLWENVWFGLMFFLSAFSTFTFATNGIRNGFACSLLTLAIACATEVKKDKEGNSKPQNSNMGKWIALGLVILSYGTHKSTILPIMAAVAAIFLIKSPKYAIYFWLFSIPVSLVFGGTVTNIFAGLGFDDRMKDYAIDAAKSQSSFSHTGFRWDFLLYSAMPVWLIWYINNKIEKYKNNVGGQYSNDLPAGTGYIADAGSMRVYNVLATTYLLSNAFWVMVCRAEFSNRFAYLSWFLYPILLAYAVVRLHIWKDQDRKAAMILLAHAGFTLVMFLLGK